MIKIMDLNKLLEHLVFFYENSYDLNVIKEKYCLSLKFSDLSLGTYVYNTTSDFKLIVITHKQNKVESVTLYTDFCIEIDLLKILMSDIKYDFSTYDNKNVCRCKYITDKKAIKFWFSIEDNYLWKNKDFIKVDEIHYVNH
ncbi:MAG: hypothetical protein CO068_09190 [Flavobacteriaceae bacterium CG_4_9_14_0_8_um_filter_34_30]|nr:MAG: hypothetical protein COY56_09250 [Flavobacteriaceae bacterium CG_4_10_14_0_8_um_filter_34_31]PJC06843.1 MAG: hypothetical protein CO068_09190 [Flavobacteriaceae bacterium CG_4_9_14_0_8_um_filter_34_30]